jgi:hypothetical protein
MEENGMGKLVIMVVVTVLLVGTGIYLLTSKVTPGVSTKGTSLNTSITTATVDASTGVVTVTAP